MRPHHERAIQKLTEHISTQEEYLALIIGGSIAKGLEREDSDIDVVLVVTDEAFKERRAQNNLIFFSLDFCDYPGGYIDGKIIDLKYLTAAAERGNEVTRAAFNGAFVAFSRIPGIEEIIRKIPVYQPQEKQEKIQAFYAQFEVAHWLVGEGIKRNDKYLLTRAAADLVLFGGRLILAHNEVLYPYHKFLMAELERVPQKPDNLLALIDALLAEPTIENAKAFYLAVRDFQFWNKAMEVWSIRFMKDTELAWLDNRAYIGDI